MPRQTRSEEHPDAAELILDRLGDILRAETRLDVHVERAIAWEQLPGRDRIPIVNLTLDRVDYPRDGSTALRWRASGRFVVEVLGFGATGPERCGDREAARECRRAVRIVRQAVMDQRHHQLGLPDVVSTHWIESVQIMAPSPETAQHHVVAARVEVRVEFYEEAAEVQAQPFELSIRSPQHSLYSNMKDPDGN